MGTVCESTAGYVHGSSTKRCICDLRSDDNYMTEDGRGKNVYKLNICGTSTDRGSDCERDQGMICQYGSGPEGRLEGVVARWDMAPYGEWSYLGRR